VVSREALAFDHPKKRAVPAREMLPCFRNTLRISNCAESTMMGAAARLASLERSDELGCIDIPFTDKACKY
jgi:hypothetical protein